MPPISARIPPHASHWILATEVIVFQGPAEFVLDFLIRLGAPHAVAARVILPPPVLGQVIAALRQNLGMYTARFGPPARAPMPTEMSPHAATATAGVTTGPIGSPTGEPGRNRPPTIAEVYDDLKLPDELLSGVYANAVMIGHTPIDFWFDFITNFFPKPAVSCRICMSAQQIPGLLEALSAAFEAVQRRAHEQQQPPQPPPDE
jgi:hypothetical protein